MASLVLWVGWWGAAANYGQCFGPADVNVMLVTSPPGLSKARNYISQKPLGLNIAKIESATERNLWKIWKEEGK